MSNQKRPLEPGNPSHERGSSWQKGEKNASPDGVDEAYARAETEDDDGYDPWSDRRPEPEPLFERDPWA